MTTITGQKILNCSQGDANFSNFYSTGIIRLAMTLLKQSDSVLMHQFGISHAQFQVLAILRQGDLVSQQALAQKACSTPPAVSRLVEALVRKKYITRQTNPDNRRENFLHLTKIGVIKFKEAVELLRELEKKLYTNLDASELKQLLATVQRLNRLLLD